MNWHTSALDSALESCGTRKQKYPYSPCCFQSKSDKHRDTSLFGKVSLCQVKQLAPKYSSSAAQTSLEDLGLLICKKWHAVLERPYKLNGDI